MKKDRWITLLSPDDRSGRKIDAVVQAAKVSRAEAIRFFADYCLEDLAVHLKEEHDRRLDEWSG